MMRALGRRLGGVLLFTALTLLATELILRVIGYQPWGKAPDARNRMVKPSFDPDVGYELIPNQSGYAWGADVTINADGFRGPRVRLGESPAFRILVLGDSVAFGFGVPYEQTFGARLSGMLGAPSAPVEVVNLSVSGYDTLQEVSLFRSRGRAYRPDLVVLTYCLNDIGVVSLAPDHVEKARLVRESPLAWSRLALTIAYHRGRLTTQSWMAEMNDPKAFRKHFADRIDPVGDDELELRELVQSLSSEYPSHWYANRYRIGRLRYALRELAEMAREDGLEVVMLMVPYLVGDLETYPHHAAHRIVEHEARRVGFVWVDVWEDFAREGMTSLKLGQYDPAHPNERGHELIAEVLRGVIEPLLPGALGDSAVAQEGSYPRADRPAQP